MPNDAIQKIKEAEDKAALLCHVAEEKANEMREQVRQKGEEHLAQVEHDTEQEYAAQLAEIRRRASLLEERKRAEAEVEADTLADAARERMGQAVKMIVWEIVEKCQ